MDQTLSSLTFRGSILEAISEAKVQKKLFVVYISGEDAKSLHMETSTWKDRTVSESLSQYCIFLHLPDGSADAANFSKIYPQKSAPCITAVSYSGVKLWQNEGFISAEDLATSIEKAWLSLHIQETTAGVVTAALAAKKSEASTSHISRMASEEQGSSSQAVSDLSSHKCSQGSDAASMTSSGIIAEKKRCEGISEQRDDDREPSDMLCESESLARQKASSSVEAGSVDPSLSGLISCEDDCISFQNRGEIPAAEKTVKGSTDIAEGSDPNSKASEATSLDEKPCLIVDVDTNSMPEFPSSSKLTDVHLNIRLPNGVSLQEKFSATSTLSVVKDYVDKYQDGNVGSYDLAIPYPRKVLADEELGKSLLELELVGRQALIVVPRVRDKGYNRGGSLSRNQPVSTGDSSTGSNGGYFSLIRRILSFVNPFSYLGGTFSSSSSDDSEDGVQQYSPDPSSQSDFARAERSHYRTSSNQDATSTGSRNENRSRRPSSRFGGNIHTLKHDEDDARFGDKNAFWNGNSTQYGGDGDNR